MTTTTNVSQVKLNIMNQSQYDSATKNPNELYMVTDAEVLPSQSGQSGKYLTTNGSTASWANVPTEIPSQSGQSGKYLTTNGTAVSWATVDALPSQSGNNGKFLTTNGSAASWASLPAADQTYDSTSTNAQSGIAVKQAIDAAVSTVYKPAGSVAFANRPSLSSSIEGNVYNITDAFTTTSDFVEGAGKNYPAGTNIVCINTATSGTAVYKWDVLTGMIDLSGYQTTITGGATSITNNDLTASRALVSNSSGKVAVSDVTATELGYLDGVTSAIQTQLNGKEATVTGAATTITNNDLTASRALISNSSGKVATSDITSTELGYLDGVTSNIQTQLDGKVNENTAITGATKCKITYDSKGLVTAGADITLSDVTDVTATATEINVLDGITASTAELNILDGVTATASELNVLDGITASTAELNYTDGVISNIQTQLDGKVNDTGDTMTGNLLMSGADIYLTSIGSVVAQSTSRLVLGTPTTEYAYLTGNSLGAFGIYTEVNGERQGIACYPDKNFFADGTTETFNLGRPESVWKTTYTKSLSNGTSTTTLAALIAKQDAITGAATTITSSNLTSNRAVVSDNSGKIAVSTVTDTELGYLSGVTSAIQTQLGNKQATVTGAASTITDSNLTINRALVSNSSGKVDISTVTSTELSHLSGVTSAIQTQLNGKQATISGAASTITSSNLGANKVVVSDSSGKIAASSIGITELGYLGSVTSDIQTQLNGKQATLTSSNAGAGITITNQVISETYPLAWEQVAETSEIPQYNVHVYWGNIDGSLSDQTDLVNALNAKAADNTVVHILGTETVSGTKNFTGSSTSNTPAASSSTATEYIATTGWVNNPQLSTNVVHRSGDETIAGVKTFTEVIQGTAYDAYYADLAEYYKTDKAYPKGTLVCFGGTAEMTEATTEVNAVISSDPGFVLNKQEDENYQPVALIGRVPVRVIGKVDKFDYIVLNEIAPGTARATKDKEAKNIIGRALESSILPGEKLVECSIKLAI